MNDEKKYRIFEHGSNWLRADFHLHTKADKEFTYTGEEDRFINDYVEGLKKAEIGLGVITNHNKFVLDEFKALRKKAKKEEIHLLPGVELSVNDGANGIHCLVVFSDEWITTHDYISPFITSMFPSKAETEYQHENGRSDKNILQVVEELDKSSRDYFIIFAHVEQKSGLWEEMKGGKLGDFTQNRYEQVRNRSLGFQKVRTRDLRQKVKGWLGDWYPAEVEGSDCKKIEDMGQGKKSYLKLGAFSFDAVKYALIDKENRVASEPQVYTHSYIKNIRFTGGTLDKVELKFSPELNALIGIRGSGKSSILELIRYALNIPFGEKSSDKDYKENLVGFTLGSGGKVEVDAVDRYGQTYTVRRVWKESVPEVLIDDILQPGVSIRETVIHKPIYFGQKDLSSTGEGFEKDLIDKLLGSKLDVIRRDIKAQEQKVISAVEQLQRVANIREQLEEQKKIKEDTQHRLKFYADHGVETKLQKQVDFEKDANKMKKGIENAERFKSELDDLLTRHEDDLINFCGYESKNNAELFKDFYSHFNSYVDFLKQIKIWLSQEANLKKGLEESQKKLAEISKGMTEEFSEIKRKLAEELKSSGSQNISSDEFLSLKKKLANAEQMLSALEKQGGLKQVLRDALLSELSKLNELFLKEFNMIKAELDLIGAEGGALSIDSEFKGDRQAFLDCMKDIGSRIRTATYQKLADKYTDFIDIFKNLENAQSLFGSNPQTLTDIFQKNLKRLLTYQVPNKFVIKYRGKELQNHSLGQRASALMLFVLSQKENDLIVIDQPEDDLDNQTIYEDVIKLIRQMKPRVQFIFATHNPNIPVLGDAEQLHSCSFVGDKEFVNSGSIDDVKIQEDIVNVMEGGREAFKRRKEIYQVWKY